MMCHGNKNQKSRLTSSELQSQEETACICPAYVTTGELFTNTNAMKFVSATTKISNQNPLQSVQPLLLCGLQYSILQLKKS